MVTWNSGKSSLEFLYVDEKSRNTYYEAWSIIETQEAAAKAEKKPADPIIGAAAAAHSGAGAAIGKDADVDVEEPPVEEKKLTKPVISDAVKAERKERQKKIRDAVDTAATALQRHQEVVGQYQTTLQTVAEDPQWGWCKADESFTKAMKTAYKQVTTLKQKDVFYGSLLTKEHEEWKKSYGKDMSQLVVAVEKKVPALLLLVEALSQEITTLTAMHYARPEIVKLGRGSQSVEPKLKKARVAGKAKPKAKG